MKKALFYLFSSLTVFFLPASIIAQDNVGIGTTTPHPQAILELVSSNQGFLMSRMNAADTAVAGMGQQGMMFFAQDVQAFLFYDGTSWQSISTGVNYWGENGTDIFNLNTGGVGIGTNSTALMLQVAQNLAGANPVMAIENQNSSGDVSYGFLNSGSATSYTMGVDGSDANKFKISNNPSLGTNDRVVIELGGNVAIGRGTANVEYYNPVNGSAVPTVLTVSGAPSYADNSPGILEIHGSSAGVNDEIGVINFTNLDDNDINNYNFARISAHRENLTNSTYSSMRFYTRAAASWNEVMRLDDNTNVGIGTAPVNKLDVEGGVAIGSGYAGSLSAFTNGMIIEGDVGIGTTTQVGNARLTISEATVGYTGMSINASSNGDPFYGYSENNVINTWTYLDGGLDTWRLYHYGEQISVTSGGKVGIGEFTAINDLDIDGNLAVGASYSGTNAAPANGAIIEGQLGIGISTVNSAYKVHMLAPAGGSQAYTLIAQNSYDAGSAYGLLSWMTGSGTGTHYGLFLNNASATSGTEYGIYSIGEDRNYLSNNLGIGTTAPQNRLDVEGAVAIGTSYSGSSTGPTNGLIVEGSTGIGVSSLNSAYKLHINTGNGSATQRYAVLAQNDYEGSSAQYGLYSWMTGAGTSTAYGLYVNNGSLTTGTEYGIYCFGEDYDYFQGNVGLGVTAPTARLQVVTGGDVNFGDTSPQGNLNVGGDGNSSQGVIVVNRTGSDGNLIRFRRDGSTQGIISVSGGTVTYGAFTGSHYGWSKKEYDKGTLVSFTGKNENMEDNPEQEIVYGIEATSRANSSNVLGAFLGKQESIPEHDLDNPYLIMAVGNGDVWVVDNGKDLVPGDYLITSDVKGHAMADLGQFEVANIVARVAEPVKWSRVKETIDGKKHKLISVTFETLVINHKAEKLESELAEIKEDLREIKSQLSLQASSEK